MLFSYYRPTNTKEQKTPGIMNSLNFSQDNPLLFTQAVFWIFFAIVLLIYSPIRNKFKLRHFYLFVVSVLFYYLSSGNFVILLLTTSILTFLIGKLLFKPNRRRKLVLVFGVIVNLLFLAYFKYTYFIVDLINLNFATDVKVVDYLALFSNNTFSTHFSIDKIVLPVGISFYTFQAISYMVDVYRGRIARQPSFVDFAFYLSFFPQLVAGPIVRANEFLPQLEKPYSVSEREFSWSVFFILNGLIKKIIISDYISVNFVDRVFEMPQMYSSFENLMAVYGYSLQIYCDFSGYTDIAIALALLLGFRLPPNFNSPYKSINITVFWRRWHISLSSWLKDYLYISLGGNRKGQFRRYLNLLLTMLIGGLWHGANLRFVIWGGLHGLALIFDKLLHKVAKGFDTNVFLRTVSAIGTFHFVCLCWIFFRASDTQTALQIIAKLFAAYNIGQIPAIFGSYWKPFTLIFIGFVIHLLPKRTKDGIRESFIGFPIVLQLLIAILVAVMLYQFKTADIQSFIYFQF